MAVMNVLWIFAHPERRSMNASLRDVGLRTLTESGHEYRESDLYAMGFNPVLDRADFGHRSSGRLFLGAEQERATTGGTLSADIRAEQEKAAWADAIVFHFPLWWMGPPAILKGWFDRVLTQGFGFGIKDDEGRTLRYGDGGLAGKRALLITSVGARQSSFAPRGIHGHADEVLFGMLHGTFFYTGMAPLEPLVVYGADRLDPTGYEREAERVRGRVRRLFTERPIAFRPEGDGEYDGDLVLCREVEPGRTGLGVHRAA